MRFFGKSSRKKQKRRPKWTPPDDYAEKIEAYKLEQRDRRDRGLPPHPVITTPQQLNGLGAAAMLISHVGPQAPQPSRNWHGTANAPVDIPPPPPNIFQYMAGQIVDTLFDFLGGPPAATSPSIVMAELSERIHADWIKEKPDLWPERLAERARESADPQASAAPKPRPAEPPGDVASDEEKPSASELELPVPTAYADADMLLHAVDDHGLGTLEWAHFFERDEEAEKDPAPSSLWVVPEAWASWLWEPGSPAGPSHSVGAAELKKRQAWPPASKRSDAPPAPPRNKSASILQRERRAIPWIPDEYLLPDPGPPLIPPMTAQQLQDYLSNATDPYNPQASIAANRMLRDLELASDPILDPVSRREQMVLDAIASYESRKNTQTHLKPHTLITVTYKEIEPKDLNLQSGQHQPQELQLPLVEVLMRRHLELLGSSYEILSEGGDEWERAFILDFRDQNRNIQSDMQTALDAYENNPGKVAALQRFIESRVLASALEYLSQQLSPEAQASADPASKLSTMGQAVRGFLHGTVKGQLVSVYGHLLGGMFYIPNGPVSGVLFHIGSGKFFELHPWRNVLQDGGHQDLLGIPTSAEFKNLVLAELPLKEALRLNQKSDLFEYKTMNGTKALPKFSLGPEPYSLAGAKFGQPLTFEPVDDLHELSRRLLAVQMDKRRSDIDLLVYTKFEDYTDKAMEYIKQVLSLLSRASMIYSGGGSLMANMARYGFIIANEMLLVMANGLQTYIADDPFKRDAHLKETIASGTLGLLSNVLPGIGDAKVLSAQFFSFENIAKTINAYQSIKRIATILFYRRLAQWRWPVSTEKSMRISLLRVSGMQSPQAQKLAMALERQTVPKTIAGTTSNRQVMPKTIAEMTSSNRQVVAKAVERAVSKQEATLTGIAFEPALAKLEQLLAVETSGIERAGAQLDTFLDSSLQRTVTSPTDAAVNTATRWVRAASDQSSAQIAPLNNLLVTLPATIDTIDPVNLVDTLFKDFSGVGLQDPPSAGASSAGISASTVLSPEVAEQAFKLALSKRWPDHQGDLAKLLFGAVANFKPYPGANHAMARAFYAVLQLWKDRSQFQAPDAATETTLFGSSRQVEPVAPLQQITPSVAVGTFDVRSSVVSGPKLAPDVQTARQDVYDLFKDSKPPLEIPDSALAPIWSTPGGVMFDHSIHHGALGMRSHTVFRQQLQGALDLEVQYYNKLSLEFDVYKSVVLGAEELTDPTRVALLRSFSKELLRYANLPTTTPGLKALLLRWKNAADAAQNDPMDKSNPLGQFPHSDLSLEISKQLKLDFHPHRYLMDQLEQDEVALRSGDAPDESKSVALKKFSDGLISLLALPSITEQQRRVLASWLIEAKVTRRRIRRRLDAQAQWQKSISTVQRPLPSQPLQAGDAIDPVSRSVQADAGVTELALRLKVPRIERSFLAIKRVEFLLQTDNRFVVAWPSDPQQGRTYEFIKLLLFSSATDTTPDIHFAVVLRDAATNQMQVLDPNFSVLGGRQFPPFYGPLKSWLERIAQVRSDAIILAQSHGDMDFLVQQLGHPMFGEAGTLVHAPSGARTKLTLVGQARWFLTTGLGAHIEPFLTYQSASGQTVGLLMGVELNELFGDPQYAQNAGRLGIRTTSALTTAFDRAAGAATADRDSLQPFLAQLASREAAVTDSQSQLGHIDALIRELGETLQNRRLAKLVNYDLQRELILTLLELKVQRAALIRANVGSANHPQSAVLAAMAKQHAANPRIPVAQQPMLLQQARDLVNKKMQSTHVLESWHPVADILRKTGGMSVEDALQFKQQAEGFARVSGITDLTHTQLPDLLDALLPARAPVVSMQDLTHVEAGKVVLFTDDFGHLKHLMLSLGDGKFAGASPSGFDAQLGTKPLLMTAEEFGQFVPKDDKFGKVEYYTDDKGQPQEGSKVEPKQKYAKGALTFRTHAGDRLRIFAGYPKNVVPLPIQPIEPMPGTSQSKPKPPSRAETLLGGDGRITVMRHHGIERATSTSAGKKVQTFNTKVRIVMHGMVRKSMDIGELYHAIRGLMIDQRLLAADYYQQNQLDLIEFLSCFGGVGGELSPAQQLANMFGVKVASPRIAITKLDFSNNWKTQTFNPIASLSGTFVNRPSAIQSLLSKFIAKLQKLRQSRGSRQRRAISMRLADLDLEGFLDALAELVIDPAMAVRVGRLWGLPDDEVHAIQTSLQKPIAPPPLGVPALTQDEIDGLHVLLLFEVSSRLKEKLEAFLQAMHRATATTAADEESRR